jgi:4'-phosphopantetheinyl transferase
VSAAVPEALSVPRLGAGDVHVWRAPLDRWRATPGWPLAVLSADERRRAARFCDEGARGRFALSRGLLRRLLSAYAGCPPAEIELAYGRWGKPALAPAVPGRVRFNLAHTGGVALVAVAKRREVGVDVERIAPERETSLIAERYFAPGENAALRALDPDARAASFFALWARKEAFAKLTGLGMVLPFARFEISPAVGPPPRILSLEGDCDIGSSVTLRDVPVGPGLAAAVAVQGAAARLTMLELVPCSVAKPGHVAAA